MIKPKTFAIHVILGGTSLGLGGAAGYFLGVYIHLRTFGSLGDTIIGSDFFLVITALVGASLGVFLYVRTSREIGQPRAKSSN